MTFVCGALCAAALASPAPAFASGSAPGCDARYRSDVVVIGAGSAGLSAALAASDAGAQVIVLEKMPMLGGSSILSASHMLTPAPGAEGAAQFREEVTEAGGSSVSPQLSGVFADNVESAVEWLEKMGADFKSITVDADRNGTKTASALRSSQGLIGEEVIKTLLHGIESRRIPVQRMVDVTSIESDGRGISAVCVTDRYGDKWCVGTSSVVIATGGFSANGEMIGKYAGMPSTNSPGSTGDGIALARTLGAKTVDMDAIVVHPTTMPFSGFILPVQTRMLGGILLNASGQRFVNELAPNSEITSKIMSQGGRAWLVIDQGILDQMPVLKRYAENGYFVTGASDGELARAMHADPLAVIDTLTQYRRSAALGRDEAFGRSSLESRLHDYPLYAISVSPGVHCTPGGLVIDAGAHIEGEKGPIPGLYAAGEVTGGVLGRRCLEGTGLSSAVVFGRIAGENAARYAKSNAPH
jgi:fumarate reductase flavoprotein subunit